MEFQLIASNKKAYRDYSLFDKWECGLALKGAEVKSLRAGGANFTDSFAGVNGQEILLYNLHIPPYPQAHEEILPDRPRKVLMHKNEINKVSGMLIQKHFLLVPTKIYFNKRGLVKVELALAKGKKLFDKREDIKKRDTDREIRRAQRRHQKGH